MSAALALGAFQMWQGLNQSKQILDNAEFTGRINEFNAESIELDAFKAEAFGYTQANRAELETDKIIASQRVAFAAQGIDVSQGTAADIQAESKLNAFFNTLDIQEAARQRARGLKNQASNTRFQGIIDQAQAQINAGAARFSGVASGASIAASGYFKGKE